MSKRDVPPYILVFDFPNHYIFQLLHVIFQSI